LGSIATGTSGDYRRMIGEEMMMGRYPMITQSMTKEDFQLLLASLGCNLPASGHLSELSRPLSLGKMGTLANRFVIQPMEGSDARPDGSPGPATIRRYERYAAGRVAVIWMEAVAVSMEGRGHQHMLHLHEQNLDAFRNLVNRIREKATGGPEPLIIMQLHHSGRYGSHPKILFHEPEIDRAAGIAQDFPILSDAELDRIADDVVEAGRLAKRSGVDAIDLKCCHGYLFNELLRARTREGRYGGSYARRTALLFLIITRLIEEVGIECAVRMDAFSAEPYPYGWGVASDGSLDLAEPIRFARDLADLGVRIVNVSNGSPFVRPYLSRPFNSDHHPPEHPLRSIERLLRCAREIQQAVPELAVVASGFSGLRQFGPIVGAASIASGGCSLIGFGRQSFAYPNLPADIMGGLPLDSRKFCTLCDGCINLLKSGHPSGCVVHDRGYHGA